MKCVYVLPVVVALSHCGGATLQSSPVKAPDVVNQQLQEQDIRQCREQLVRIHAGIKQYHADHKRLPRFLSDLVPKYCHQADFTCPAKAHVGDPAWARRWLRDEALVDEKLPANSYSYEFIDKSWQGTSVTYSQYKSAQRDFLGLNYGKGDSVPLLRCFMHGATNVLNIGFGGDLFPSGIEWEEAYSLAHDELDVPGLLPHVQVKLEGSIPPRLQQFGPEVLDLSASYNATVNRSWYVFPTLPEPRFAQLSASSNFVGSVPFDVRGVVQLKGQQLHRPFPLHIRGIRVAQTAQKVHCLIGAYGSAPENEKIAELRLNFKKRSPVPFEIIYGEDVLHWSSDPAQSLHPELKRKVAWLAECPGENGQVDSARLYHFQRPNPFPNDEIVSIDLEVAAYDDKISRSAPALFAVTLEP